VNLWISGPFNSGAAFTAGNKSVDKKCFFQAFLLIEIPEKNSFS